jgi:hypothetical protein
VRSRFKRLDEESARTIFDWGYAAADAGLRL